VPILAALALVIVVVLAAVMLMPLALVQRYRTGTARRLARGWVATINVVGIGLSTATFLAGAAVTSIWVPETLTHTLAGLAAGCLLGLAGLAATRWEATPRALYYTPNRLLVLGVTLVVAARVSYGFWRAWHSWRLGLEEGAWLVASGAAGSLAAGALVLGYYFTFWTGVRRKIVRQPRMRL
jgi:hypothetical protein